MKPGYVLLSFLVAALSSRSVNRQVLLNMHKARSKRHHRVSWQTAKAAFGRKQGQQKVLRDRALLDARKRSQHRMKNFKIRLKNGLAALKAPACPKHSRSLTLTFVVDASNCRNVATWLENLRAITSHALHTTNFVVIDNCPSFLRQNELALAAGTRHYNSYRYKSVKSLTGDKILKTTGRQSLFERFNLAFRYVKTDLICFLQDDEEPCVSPFW